MYYILTPLACSFIKKFLYFNLINLINFFIAGVYSVSTAILDVCHFLCSYLLHSTNCYIHNKSLFCLVITYWLEHYCKKGKTCEFLPRGHLKPAPHPLISSLGRAILCLSVDTERCQKTWDLRKEGKWNLMYSRV